jgi:hypothetical protein
MIHYDSFGPIGFGIHSPPGGDIFKPSYEGPAAAFESFEHIIGSPASIGTIRVNDVGSLYFGGREAIKLAFAMLTPTETTSSELANSQAAPKYSVGKRSLYPTRSAVALTRIKVSSLKRSPSMARSNWPARPLARLVKTTITLSRAEPAKSSRLS